MTRGHRQGVDDAPARGRLSAVGTAEDSRLVVDRRRAVMAGDLLVLIQHPGHGLRAGADIRARHVVSRTAGSQIAHVGPAQSFVFPLAERPGIGRDTALAATGGNASRGMLDRHQESERLDLVHVDVRRDACSVPGRAKRIAVANPVGVEYAAAPVVHPHRQPEGNDPCGGREQVDDRRIYAAVLAGATQQQVALFGEVVRSHASPPGLFSLS